MPDRELLFVPHVSPYRDGPGGVHGALEHHVFAGRPPWDGSTALGFLDRWR